MSFKVGDKVRCVKEDSFSIKKDSFLNLAKVNVGEVYTVVSCGLGAIRVKEVEGAYWMECFEFAGPEEIYVGDVWMSKFNEEMVRIVGIFRPFGVSRVSFLVLNGISKGCAEHLDAEIFKDGYTKKFDKLPSFEEKDHRDRVPSVGKNLFEPRQHICMPRNTGRNLAMKEMVGILPVGGCDTLDALMYWQSAYNRSLIARISPTVTKIIHNGTTTITFFSDGKKVITRPSQDDVEKYDPFVGWCVGVVEHLYGGKEKAKKFYKKHAVVQKEAK